MDIQIQETVIRHSRFRLVGIAIAALAMITASFILVSLTHRQGGMAFFLADITALLVLVLFGFTLVRTVQRLFGSAPALVINDRGFQDGASAVEAGLITWDEVKEIHAGQWWWQTFVCVELKHLDRFIGRYPVWTQRLMRAYYETLDSPICISALSLPVSLDEVRVQLQNQWMNRRVHVVPDLEKSAEASGQISVRKD